MTSLLAHTVAQPTKWRFLPKNLNQLVIFVIGLDRQLIKIGPNFRKWTTSKRKLSKYGCIISCSPNLMILTETKINIITYFWYWKLALKIKFWRFLWTHDQVIASSITNITSWFKFFGKNLHLVDCATVCTKSDVMLT